MGLGLAEVDERLGGLSLQQKRFGLAEDLIVKALSRYEALGSDRALVARLRMGFVRASRGRSPEIWEVLLPIQRRLVYLKPAAAVVAGKALGVIRHAIDCSWKGLDKELDALQGANAPGVAWTFAITSALAQAAGVTGLAERAAALARAQWNHEDGPVVV
jgi:hypothetical protein